MPKPPQLFDDPTVSEPERSKHWKRKGEHATPSPIGSGPPGETCKTCRSATRIKYHDKTYYKCGLMEKCWTHGGASDIKLRWEACRSWFPLKQRVLGLGEFAVRSIETCGWTRECLHIIAEEYEEAGNDMGWLRHAANALQKPGG
jgi:hypothetical protein